MKGFVLFSTLLLVTAAASANRMNDMLSAKPAEERSVLLAKLLNNSGKNCGAAKRIFFQGMDRDDAAYWNVACSTGKNYMVQIPADPNANTRVLDCNFMKAVGVNCFTRLD